MSRPSICHHRGEEGERERRQIERQGRWEVRVERFTQNV
jgi:hypothetical protein